MVKGVTLGPEAVNQIEEVVRRVLGQPGYGNTRESKGQWFSRTFMQPAKTDGSGITARSGDTPGTGNVTLYEVDDTTGDLSQVNATALVVKNIASSSVAASTYVLVCQDHKGHWWVAVEDCG